MRAIAPRDAVITGAGAACGLGYGVAAGFAGLLAGESALRPLQDGPADAALTTAAVLASPLLQREVPRAMLSEVRLLNGAGELAAEAVMEALEDAALPKDGVPPERRGLYLSQMDSGDWSCMEFRPAVVAATEDFQRPLEPQALNEAANRGRKTKPHFMLESLKNNAFSFLATLFDLRGPNTSVAGFAGATQQAMDMGVRALARGSLDVAVICGAARPTSGVARTEMKELHIDTPPGDGAGALVLERAEDASARGAEPCAAILGLGAATVRPPEGSFAPPVEALVAAAEAALSAAEAVPGDLRGIVAPGLGEADLEQALAALPAAAGVPIVTWKPLTGHMALASDAVEAVYAAEAVRRGVLPTADAGEATGGQAILLLTAGLLGQAGALVLAPA